MNGRIYDPKLGRMLQADPFIQSPTNSQSLNRYSYVLNNPLSYTDPSGYFFSRLWKKWVRPIAAIAITAVGMAFAPYLAPVWGALSGWVATGNLQGALVGAFSSIVFSGIGNAFASVQAANAARGISGLTALQTGAKVLAHGIAGGIMSMMSGGKFGHGFASAGFTQSLGGRIGAIDAQNAGFSIQRTLAAAAVGGTASELTGGKFANGAITGAFSRAFNDEIHNLLEAVSSISQQGAIVNEAQNLSVEQFKLLFPSYSGLVDLDLDLAKASLREDFLSGVMDGQIKDAVSTHGTAIVKEYYSDKVSGGIGAGAKAVGIAMRALKLTDSQIRIVSDVYRVQSAMTQLGSEISSLGGLATYLQSNPDAYSWYSR